jgi:hypothetical protein
MKRATKFQSLLNPSREARRLRRRIKDGRRFIDLGVRKGLEWSLRRKRALEYLLSPGDPALYHDQEAMADALRTIEHGDGSHLLRHGGTQ